MKIEFLAHACFLITRENGMKIMVDPYESGGFSGRVGYDTIVDNPDLVIITHDHLDHNHTQSLNGSFEVIRHKGTYRGVRVSSVQAFHDQEQGTRFGGTIDMKLIEVDGIRICHCGDIGETIDDDERQRILKNLDFLIIPVGGYYTVDAELAFKVTQQLNPKWVIPCHYKTLSCGFDIAPVDPFLEKFDQVVQCPNPHFDTDALHVNHGPGCITMPMKYDRATTQVVGTYRRNESRPPI